MKSTGADAMFGRASRSREAAAITLRLVMVFVAATGCAKASDIANSSSETEVSCSEAWYRSIEEKVPTGDGRGHGPDIGSDEWKSVVEFKLGIRGKSGLPGRDSEDWCRHIGQLVRIHRSSSAAGGDSGGELRATQPSFPCDKVCAI